MEVTGRLASDASVKKTRNEKEVVAFTVAVNDYYKPKDGEARKFTEYITCSYWQSSKIAMVLLKGAIVTVTGRIYLNQYKDKDGEMRANLAFHANEVKVIAKAGKGAEPALAGAPDTKDDVPF